MNNWNLLLYNLISEQNQVQDELIQKLTETGSMRNVAPNWSQSQTLLQSLFQFQSYPEDIRTIILFRKAH